MRRSDMSKYMEEMQEWAKPITYRKITPGREELEQSHLLRDIPLYLIFIGQKHKSNLWQPLKNVNTTVYEYPIGQSYSICMVIIIHLY